MRYSTFVASLVVAVAAVAHAGITVSQLTNGSSVPLNMRVVASASPSSSSYRISAMQIVVNSVMVYSTSNSSLDTYVGVKSGSNRVQVKAWDTSGAYFEKLMYVTGTTLGRRSRTLMSARPAGSPVTDAPARTDLVLTPPTGGGPAAPRPR